MPTDIEFADAALSLVGKRYGRHGRSERAVDCVGVVIVAARAVGLSLPDRRDYDPTMPNSDMLHGMLGQHFESVGWGDCGAGRVAFCRRAEDIAPMHLVVMTADRRLVHADAGIGRVRCDHADWMDGRVFKVYRIPGIDYGEPWQ